MKTLPFELLTLLLFLKSDGVSSAAVNVALNKQVTADTVCGLYGSEGYNLNSEIGVLTSDRQTIFCETNDGAHIPEFMVDGDLDTAWQSTSRFNIYENRIGDSATHREASVTLDLDQLFQVEKIILDMSESVRPRRILIQKAVAVDGTGSPIYNPWIILVSDPANCQVMFDREFSSVPTSPYFTICNKFPFLEETISNQKIEFDISTQSYDFRQARYLNISFYQMAFVGGVTGNSFQHYTVRELNVLAECSCFGHDIACEKNNETGQFACVCGENTMGAFCELCKPFYNQVGWKKDVPCEGCNCFNHSNVCTFDPSVAAVNGSLNALGERRGGGVCTDCKNNTAGINCQTCAANYYRPVGRPQNADDACVFCGCVLAGVVLNTETGQPGDCVVNDDVSRTDNKLPGDCFCKPNVEGSKCDTCKAGFYDLTEDNLLGCKECGCNTGGAVNASPVCDRVSGQCSCKPNVDGRQCDVCKDGFYLLSADDPNGCTSCGCDVGGVDSGGCNKVTGQCSCLPRVGGLKCDTIDDNSYYPELHYIFSEAETPTGERGDDPALEGFHGYGFAILNENDTVSVQLNIPSKVPASQLFRVVLIYRTNAAVTGQVTVSGDPNITAVTLRPCSGWCSLQVGGDKLYNLQPLRTYSVSIKSGGYLLLDRVVAIPEEFLKPNILGVNDASFAQSCQVLKNGVGISPALAEGCKNQIYSVVTHAVSGGLFCDCNLVGSNSSQCQKTGGQCPCRPGVGGRKCDQCLPDHYRMTLTGCTPCDCAGVNKLCNAFTGQCYCSPNTTGRRCDQCITLHYNWREVQGCEACDCGEGSSSLQCNQTSGVCPCQAGVTGDKCGSCEDGFKSLTNAGCPACGCTEIGSANSICNKTSGQCSCKENVVGLVCDQCAAASFDLSDLHPKGCADCVCMGVTSNCASSAWRLQQVPVPLVDETSQNLTSLLAVVTASRTDTGVTIRGERQIVDPVLTASLTIGVDPVYWNVDYEGVIGNVLGMYGSFMEFTTSFTAPLGGTAQPLRVIMIYGAGQQMMYSLESISDPDTSFPIKLLLTEKDWTNGGQAVTRQDFILALSQVQAWLLPARLISTEHQVLLSNVRFTIATPNGLSSDKAVHIEQCVCGNGYTGLSCERCAPGYKRYNVTDHPYLGLCEPCSCNGQSTQCDPNTGVCLDCQGNTQGDSCQECQPGYYGSPSLGEVCVQCPCLSPRVSDPGCELQNGTVVCLHCNEGYTDPLCNRCKPFYYGQPLLENVGTCSPCDCNGNSQRCDSVTGVCQNCTSDTAGDNCERCADGFYGNATAQTCAPCGCDTAGSTSQVCNAGTGLCTCLPGVGERTCNQCQQGFWGYSDNTFAGCRDCECNPDGSSDIQCIDSTAVCPCRDEAEGDKCNQCRTDFWGLPDKPCTACDCSDIGSLNRSEPCDLVSGKCRCKSGVGGRQCDTCMKLYVGFGIDGCTKCGECETSLGNDTAALEATFDRYWSVAVDVAGIQEQDQRLESVRQQLTTAQSQLGFSDLTTLQGLIDTLTSQQADYTAQVADLQTRLEASVSASQRLKTQVSSEQDRLRSLVGQSTEASESVTAALTSAEGHTSQLTSFDTAANNLVADGATGSISSNLTFSSDKSAVDAELTSVKNTSSRVDVVKGQVDTQNEAVVTYKGRVDGLRTETMAIQTRIALVQSDVATVRNDRVVLEGSLQTTQNQVLAAETMLNATTALVATINSRLEASTVDYQRAGVALADCSLVLGENPFNRPLPLNTTVDISGIQSWPSAYQSLSDSVTQVTANIAAAQSNSPNTVAAQLQRDATALQTEFMSVEQRGLAAVTAQQSYQDAVNSLTASLARAQEASRTVAEQDNAIAGVNLANLETSAVNSRTASEAILAEVNQRNYQPTVLVSRLLSAGQNLQNAVLQWNNTVTVIDTVTTRAEGLRPSSTGTTISETLSQTDSKSQVARSLSDLTRINDQTLSNTLSNLAGQSVVQQSQTQDTLNVVDTIQASVTDFESRLQTTETLLSESQSLYNSSTGEILSIESRLTALEEKIARARLLAEKLKQPVYFDAKDELSKMPVEAINPDAASDKVCNKVRLDYRPAVPQSNGLLFFMENPDSESVFYLELVNGKVKFGFTISLEPVVMFSQAVVQQNQWATVEASRCGNRGQLTVTLLSTGGTAVSHRSGVTIRARTMMLTSSLYLGGLPEGFNTSKVSSNSYTGCLYNVWYGSEEVDLWKLRVNSGQAGCCPRPVSFNPVPMGPGTGLSGFGHLQLESPITTTSGPPEISLQFRTFMPTSVLYIFDNGGTYYGVFMLDGKVIFELRSSQTYRLESELTYEDGEWYRVTTRSNATHQEMILTYGANGTFFPRESFVSSVSFSDVDLSVLQGQPITFGSLNPVPSIVSATIRSRFAGYISSFGYRLPGQTSTAVPLDSGVISETGVYRLVPDKIMSGLTLFSDQSYAQLSLPTAARTIRSLSVFFSTFDSDGVLLYAVSDMSTRVMIYLAMNHGNIVLYYNEDPVGQLKGPVETEGLYLSDGVLHHVSVRVVQVLSAANFYRVQLEVDNIQKVDNQQIFLPTVEIGTGPVYVGGVPSSITMNAVLPITDSLRGGISSLLINTGPVNLLDLSLYVDNQDVSLAGIPHPRAAAIPPPYPISDTSIPTSCLSPVPAAKYSDTGVRFGGSDFPVSFQKHQLTDIQITSLRQSFVLSIKFRSFAQNGTLFYVADQLVDPISWFAVYLVNGYITVSMSSSSKDPKTANLQSVENRYDSGTWWEVDILRVNDFLAIVVVSDPDDYKKNALNTSIPSTLDFKSPAFIGGLDQTVSGNILPAIRIGKTPLIGCISKVKITPPKDLLDPFTLDLSNPLEGGKRPCFSNAVSGVRMTGTSSYILINPASSPFSFTAPFTFSVTLRTTKTSGTLLTVYQSSTGFVLVDIKDGQVFVILGNTAGQWVVAQSQQTNPYFLCNNEPHSVSVEIREDEITLIVDKTNIRTDSIPTGFTLPNIQGYFSIGGIPPELEVSSEFPVDVSRTSFTGCLDDLTVNGQSLYPQAISTKDGLFYGCFLS